MKEIIKTFIIIYLYQLHLFNAVLRYLPDLVTVFFFFCKNICKYFLKRYPSEFVLKIFMMLISKTRVKKHSNCVTFSYQKKIFRSIDKNFLTVNDISNKIPVESEKREETFRIGLIRSYGKLLRIP